MKHTLLLATAALAFCITSCNRHEAVDPGANSVKTYTTNPGIMHNAGRLVTSAYCKPIAIDSANRMINSYITSVGYPYVDTSVRSLAFDADTIFNYLKKNKDVTTLKFFLGHQLGWLNANTGNYGKNIGLTPGKLTIICVGLDDNGNIVPNSSGGVYEHAMPCPSACGPSGQDPVLVQ